MPLALVSLNNTNYSRLNYSISPQILNTGVRADFNCTFASLEDDYLTQTGFSNYAVSLNKNQYVNFYLLTQLRKEQDAKNQKTHTKKDTNKIEPGNLVYKTDKALNLKGFSKKLRPRFTKLYLVLCITSTSAYIRIYKQDLNTHKDLMTFEQFLHNPRDNKSKVLPNFQVEKVDLSEIKKVKNLIPLTRESNFFNDNFQVNFPDEKDFEVIENQPIYSLAPDFDNEIPREIDNPIFTHNKEEENQTDTNTIF